MKRNLLLHFSLILVYLCIGFVIGIIFDKEWLTNEQISYTQRLALEKELLLQEKRAWESYVEAEFKGYAFYTTVEDEAFQHLGQIFAGIGVSLEKLPEVLSVSQQQGIIVSIGEELDETYGLTHLNLTSIPHQAVDINLLYLSLLKMKEELLQ